jgi:hypothetical protein
MSTKRILIFSATEGYRHDSIPTAIEAFRKLELDLGVHFETTEDEVVLRDESLAKFDAVLFLSNMGEGTLAPISILNLVQQDAELAFILQSFLRRA